MVTEPYWYAAVVLSDAGELAPNEPFRPMTDSVGSIVWGLLHGRRIAAI